MAVVFGQERAGLDNHALQHCQYHVIIPTAKDYHSLNLAQAVQILCYELQLACEDSALPVEKVYDDFALQSEVNGFYEHLESVLRDVGFMKDHNAHRLILKLRRLFNRTRLEKVEVAILRGILSAVERIKRVT